MQQIPQIRAREPVLPASRHRARKIRPIRVVFGGVEVVGRFLILDPLEQAQEVALRASDGGVPRDGHDVVLEAEGVEVDRAEVARQGLWGTMRHGWLVGWLVERGWSWLDTGLDAERYEWFS